MIVTLISQCEKKALARTRRVLDAFADRIGDNTWQTVITEDGLLALKKLLRQSATKNTAVSCHWIRGRRRSELLWVVGNRSKFNSEGVVPVNFTEQEILKKESFLPNTEVIAFLAAIAGYFHDVGKSNRLFQEKLGAIKNNEDTEAGKRYKKKYEPLRHEWISLRLFQAFVDQQTDQQWLQSLVDINHQTSEKLIHSLPNYQDLLTEDITNPFEYLPPIAKMVAWLIVSHHRLPQFPAKLDNQPNLDNIDDWQKIFEPCWNSSQAATEEWDLSVTQANWQFPLGTPFDSAFWQTNISTLAKRMLSSRNLFDNQWHDNLFTQHLARLALMLADHAESSKVEVDNSNSDRNFLAYANTDKDEQGNRYLKQKLDEHNIHVGNLAYSVACALPSLQSNLKTLDRVKALERPVPEKYKFDFGWQDKATKLAKEIKETVKTHGFFGISMASTGKGKTRANAKIMYALSEQDQCRFNVALGLRTLSIQTAKALKADLFGDDEKSQQQAQENIALLVGSQAVRDLQQINLAQENSTAIDKGSESQESLLKDETVLLENLSIGLSEEYEWLAHDKKILRLLHAPILVSTIDYLMPATEGIRGGRQIAPMLRLLSSDLVLDEPDDFSSADFPALCRLVNWAGMLGSKVLISTATIIPVEAQALFEAYKHGRDHYLKAKQDQSETSKICCAWFDECNTPNQQLIDSVEAFKQTHAKFVIERDKKLAKTSLKLRQGKLIDINGNEPSYSERMASRIYQSIIELHKHHTVDLADKHISIGLVRIANINPLVQIAKLLLAKDAPSNTRIHYCVYHGQYPLLQRTSIEQLLDKALKRHDYDTWCKDSGIAEIVRSSKEQHHIFVVLATSVAEVGRDHDYDWAVVEPSSQRSIIQLAGRVQRHRKQTPKTANIHVLAKNYKGLKGMGICFTKPGFETSLIRYCSYDLHQLNIEDSLTDITASSRLLEPSAPALTNDRPPKFMKFSELEHIAQHITLYGSKSNLNYAARWWKHNVSWCAEMQRLQPFRQSLLSHDYCLMLTRENKAKWQRKVEGEYPIKYQPTDDIQIPKNAVALASGVSMWHHFDLAQKVISLSEKVGKSQLHTLQTYTHVSLQEYDTDNPSQWYYQAELGIYKQLRKDDCGNDK